MRSCRSSGQDKSGYIRASDQEQDANGPEQYPQHRAHVGNDARLEWLDSHRDSGLGVHALGVLRHVALVQRVHLALGLGERRPRLEASDDVLRHHELPKPGRHLGGVRRACDPHVDFGKREVEPLGQNSHDRVWLRIQQQDPSGHLWVRTETALPQTLAEDDCGPTRGMIFFRDEATPYNRLSSHYLEKVRRDPRCHKRFGITGRGEDHDFRPLEKRSDCGE